MTGCVCAGGWSSVFVGAGALHAPARAVIRRLSATAVTDRRRVPLVEMMVNLLEGGFEDAAAGSLIGRVDEDVLPVSRCGGGVGGVAGDA